jgi:hypothetical protein
MNILNRITTSLALITLIAFSLKTMYAKEYVDTVYKVIPITFDQQSNS